jgi:hypothetical protein
MALNERRDIAVLRSADQVALPVVRDRAIDEALFELQD